MGASIKTAWMELKTLARGRASESRWWGCEGKGQEADCCCQVLENLLLMEWAKAERDSKREGSRGRDVTQMAVGERLKRQCAVLMCSSMGSCESKTGWNKWNGARSHPTKHHYKQLREYYASGTTSMADGEEGARITDMEPFTLEHHSATCIWCGSAVQPRIQTELSQFSSRGLLFWSSKLRKPLKAQNITRQLPSN